MREYLTFDDVNIRPRYSEVKSRKDGSLLSKFTPKHSIRLPIIAAPMDTVCEHDMALELLKAGGVGCVHRFLSIDEQVAITTKLRYFTENMHAYVHTPPTANTIICMAIGANGDSIERARALLKAGANVLLVDIAHGHHIHMKHCIKELVKLKGEFEFEIIGGNVATAEGALDLESWGADAVRVGIGGGSVCETRLRTGIGVPQLSCISDIYQSKLKIPIISDGGVRYIGDVVKALCAGADTIMVGSLLAGTTEAPGSIFVDGSWPNSKKYKMYRGSASETIKLEKNGNSLHVEGASKMVQLKGDASQILNDIKDGITSAMSYLGVEHISEMREKAEFIRVTSAGIMEAKPHLL